MRVSDVRKKYPEFFVRIENDVWFYTDGACGTAKRKRIAYNAAAIATLELHKIMVASRKKAKVAGKTSNNTLKAKIAALVRQYGACSMYNWNAKVGAELVAKLRQLLAI